MGRRFTPRAAPHNPREISTMNLARNPFLRRGGFAAPDAIGAGYRDSTYTDSFGQARMKLQFSPAQYQAILAQNAANALRQAPPHAAAPSHPMMQGFRLHPPPFTPAIAAQAAGSGEVESAYWGIDSGAALIAVGFSATITVQPQEACWPSGMNVTQSVADNFLITSIAVGVQPLLTTTGAISAAIFVQNTTAPRFRRIFLQVGKNFSIGVINISAAPARFAATAFGPSAEPRGTCT